MKNLMTVSGLLAVILHGVTLANTAGEWRTVSRDRLCVTEGTIEKAAGDRMSVKVPKMRAYVNQWTSQSAELRFTYLGGTSEQLALGSGAVRRQVGLKLHALDACNLVYAMWRIEPEQKLVVSVKRNPNAHASAECGNRGYENIKPQRHSALPHLQPGQSHTLRAEMKNSELRVFADGNEVWEGDVGTDAANFNGPIGIRSDNARLEFTLQAGQYEGVHPMFELACKAGAGEE
jgi:hypothetical protein